MRSHNKFLTATIILFIFALFIIFIPCDLASAQETKPESNQQLISLSFRDAELDYVLDFFARATGYTILKNADIKARVTIISQKDVTIDEALSVLSSICICLDSSLRFTMPFSSASSRYGLFRR